ncbi:PWWP domain-containing DNA repair factor 3A, partial [Saguinus oedipus]
DARPLRPGGQRDRHCVCSVLAASQNEVPAAPLEELAYRRSLRVALDVLSEGLVWSQESSTDTGRAERSPRAKSTERASSPCDCSSSSPPGGGALGSSGLHRRECVRQSLSRPFTCEKDPKCKVDHKKGLRKSDSPRGPSVLPTGGGSQDGSQSRIHRKSWTLTTKRGRDSAQKSSLGPGGSALSESDAEEDSGSKAGLWAAPSSPSQLREGDPCASANGRNPVLPSGSLTVPPACSGPSGCPAKKRPRLDGSQRLPAVQLEPRAAGAAPSPGPEVGPREFMTLQSTASPRSPPSHAPVDETRRPRPDSQKLEEGKSFSWRRAAAGVESCSSGSQTGEQAARLGSTARASAGSQAQGEPVEGQTGTIVCCGAGSIVAVLRLRLRPAD